MMTLAYWGYRYYYDPTYLLVFLGAILSLIASMQVNGTFSRYSKVRSASGMTGAETARRILDRNGLYDVRIEHVRGNLTDHYDPRTRVLRLSDATYGARSVAAVGVAAHECGHAVQHSEGYAPLNIRSKLAPAANFGSQFGLPIFILGDTEAEGSRKVLKAAAMTYVAAAVSAILNLLRLVLIARDRDRD